MSKDILKVAGIGIFAGVLLAFPFILFRLLMLALFFLLVSRLFGWRRHYSPMHHPAFARHWQQMSEEERQVWKERFKQRHYGRGGCRQTPPASSPGAPETSSEARYADGSSA